MTAALAYKIAWTEGEKEIFRQKPVVSVSQWAEKNRVVIRGPKQGPWSNEFAPYAVTAMDLFIQPYIQKIVLKWAPQTIKTSTAINMLMYAIDYDPDDALYVMPDEKVAKKIARKQIIPSLKSSPAIARLISPRFDDVTSTHVSFQNGMDLDLAWATSAAELASDAYRYLFLDETGKWPALAGREGDPLYLAEIRTTAYPYTKKIVIFSSPNEETDAISRAEAECDQHMVYHARCPACGTLQQMRFRRYVWPEDAGWKSIRRKRLARYQCEHCPMEWTDHLRNRAVASGEWHIESGAEIARPISVAMHLPVYYSPLVSLSDTVSAYLQGRTDRAKMKIFVTQHKAEEWKEVIEKPDQVKILRARCELAPQTVPADAIALSCGIDVQKYGFWFVVRAWARDFSSWLIHYGQLPKWPDVEALLFEATYPGADGRQLRIWRCAMDTGGGGKYEDMTMTEETYWWIRKNGIGRGCRVYATKGASRPLIGKVHLNKPLDRTPSGKPLPGGLQLFTLDTEKIKDMVVYRLNNAVEHGPQASYLHSGCGEDYARQITAEEKRRDRKGHEAWVQIRQDNHLFDCECLAQIVVDPEWPGGGLNLLRGALKDNSADPATGRRVISRGVTA